MRRIEVFGHSGVGKSTMFSAARARNFPKYKFEFIGDYERELKKIISAIGVKQLALWTDAADYGYFLERCISIVASSKKATASQKITAINLVNNVVRQHAALPILERGADFCIADEFFLHRSFAICALSNDLLADAREYFSYVPIPDVAIYCTATPETVVSRALAREKSVNSYTHLTPDQVYELVKLFCDAYEVGCEILKNRGVVLWELSMEGDIEEVGSRFLSVLSDIQREFAL